MGRRCMTTASEELRTLFEHHAWATAKLMDRLEELDPEQLDREIPGTYGSIARTLTHLVDADERYLLRMDSPSLPPREDRDPQPLKVLRERMDENGKRWHQMLDRLDAGSLEATIDAHDDWPYTPQAERVLFLQAIHHGNDHRTQICSTLGALGLDVPDLDGWEFWRGRL
jgi:uncharacterized damage-inducible protein DinB